MNYRLGILGVGHMTKAIIDSIASNNNISKKDVFLYTRNKDTLNKYEEKGFSIVRSIEELKEKVDILLIGVKPQNLADIIDDIKDFKGTLVSILAGISINYFERYFDSVIRVMPNLPLKINQGATAISFSENVNRDILKFVMVIFECMGKVAILEENQMNNVIALSGSVPAYVYYFIDAISKDAIRRGIDKNTAREFAIQTFIGSALYLQQSEKSISEGIDAVCSKGGTTIEAISTFDELNLFEIIKNANDKCIRRADELSLEYEK